jgi:hypothetical protein
MTIQILEMKKIIIPRKKFKIELCHTPTRKNSSGNSVNFEPG